MRRKQYEKLIINSSNEAQIIYEIPLNQTNAMLTIEAKFGSCVSIFRNYTKVIIIKWVAALAIKV